MIGVMKSVGFAALMVVAAGLATTLLAQAPIKAQARPTPPPAPAWTKGILPISAESYWNAVECGKLGGADSPCVFWDTGICKNSDYSLAFYTAYKMVAYEVWNAVRQKQPAPTPNYAEAGRTRVTIGVTAAPAAKNPLTDFVVKRGSRTMASVDRQLIDGGGRFTYDYPAFAATADVTISLVGRTKTIACVLEQPVLSAFR